MAMAIPVGSPKSRAHSPLKCPAGLPGGHAVSYNRSRRAASFGSRRDRNALGGRPSQASEYMALWPAAQMQRTILAGSVTPDSTAGTKSASSTQLAAESNTSGASFRHRQIFDHHHSDEYVPPMGASSSGACALAIAVIATASAADVWSFHSQACAARLSFHRGSMASGRACASTGSGVDPVVSTPMPTTRSRENPGSVSASVSAPITDTRSPSM